MIYTDDVPRVVRFYGQLSFQEQYRFPPGEDAVPSRIPERLPGNEVIASR